MSIELTVPEVGESISEVQIGKWLKADGAAVAKDEDLVEIETEKASVVVSAPAAGTLRIAKAQGEMAKVGEVIGSIAEGGAKSGAQASAPAPAAAAPAPEEPPSAEKKVMPAAARAAAEAGVDVASVKATGPMGHVLKEDVQRAKAAAPAAPTAAPAPAPAPAAPTAAPLSGPLSAGRAEEVRPMSMIRRTIATRLVAAQQAAALLTTFNEVDMAPVMELRKRYKEAFEERHGIKLGFMSFFVKAAVEALRAFPAVNAEVRGNDIVYRNYHDIGIAIGGGKGLVVPILRNAEAMNFADIEVAIADFGKRAQANAIKPDELAGGTFTISNGGVYGSLLSTPIVNPPQSGILGMHAIQDRPVARDGQVVIRPMMYLALTYDHRIIDGREAVTFLRTIKDVLEDPARLALEV